MHSYYIFFLTTFFYNRESASLDYGFWLLFFLDYNVVCYCKKIVSLSSLHFYIWHESTFSRWNSMKNNTIYIYMTKKHDFFSTLRLLIMRLFINFFVKNNIIWQSCVVVENCCMLEIIMNFLKMLSSFLYWKINYYNIDIIWKIFVKEKRTIYINMINKF